MEGYFTLKIKTCSDNDNVIINVKLYRQNDRIYINVYNKLDDTLYDLTLNLPDSYCCKYGFYAKEFDKKHVGWAPKLISSMLNDFVIEDTGIIVKTDKGMFRHFQFISKEWKDAIDDLRKQE
jgi:hypothetical protein